MILRVREFFKERFPLTSLGSFFRDPQPPSVGWLHSLGSVLLFLFVLQFITGSFLMLFYAPTPDDAWESLKFLIDHFFSGKILRNLHAWGASLIVIVATLHILRTLLHGAYKRPRELSWVTGVFLFLSIFAFAFTGYLLPWDQKAYWATKVGTEMISEAPGFGSSLAQIVRGGDELGAYTLTRFYAVHVVFLPALLAFLVLMHLFLLRKHKIAPHPLPEKRFHHTFPFYPFQFFRDSMLSLLVFFILLFLAVAAPVGLDPKANPANTAYEPRPEWYFLAHYELLRLFKGFEILPIAIIPTLAIVLLLALPFLDRSEERHWKRRKAVVLSVTGFFILMYGAAVYSLFFHAPAGGPSQTAAAAKKDLPLPDGGDRALVLRGRRVFQSQRCANCHQLGGVGGLVGPALNDVARKHPPERIREQILDPTKLDPETKMPTYRGKISDEDLRAVVEYLANFK